MSPPHLSGLLHTSPPPPIHVMEDVHCSLQHWASKNAIVDVDSFSLTPEGQKLLSNILELMLYLADNHDMYANYITLENLVMARPGVVKLRPVESQSISLGAGFDQVVKALVGVAFYKKEFFELRHLCRSLTLDSSPKHIMNALCHPVLLFPLERMFYRVWANTKINEPFVDGHRTRNEVVACFYWLKKFKKQDINVRQDIWKRVVCKDYVFEKSFTARMGERNPMHFLRHGRNEYLHPTVMDKRIWALDKALKMCWFAHMALLHEMIEKKWGWEFKPFTQFTLQKV